MKHFALLFAAAMLLVLTGCDTGPPDGLEETPMDAALLDVLAESERELFEDFSENPPVSMTVRLMPFLWSASMALAEFALMTSEMTMWPA